MISLWRNPRWSIRSETLSPEQFSEHRDGMATEFVRPTNGEGKQSLFYKGARGDLLKRDEAASTMLSSGYKSDMVGERGRGGGEGERKRRRGRAGSVNDGGI